MCFAEYLAYTCGHTSIAVNRPCPMTTHLWNNPCCPRPASRPFLCQSMCPSCNRIQHSRKVDINEYEHRWMHERGACGCEVQFPAMLHPRVVRRSTAAADDEGAAEAGAGYASPQQEPFSQSSYQGRGQGAAIPLFKEAQVGENVEVEVRLSSLYAAEWTADHAKLHQTGQCKCPVSFERYTPHRHQDMGNYSGEEEVRKPARIRRLPSEVYRTTRPEQPPPPPGLTTPPYQANNASGPPGLGVYPTGNNMHSPYNNYPRIPPGHVARWAMEGPSGSLLDDILGPIRRDHYHDPSYFYGGRPADVQTVQYSYDGVPISGYPIVGGPSPESCDLPSIVDFQQPEVTLAGFPLGAGPEGESHAGNFETCSLKSSTEDDDGESPVRMRRLSSEF